MKIEIIKDHESGLKKGQTKEVMRGIGENLIAEGVAKKAEKAKKSDKTEKKSTSNKSE